MPGTHSDNDHSFIERLPFAYKKIAYQIIRNRSLEGMLADLRSQDSAYFNELKKAEGLNTQDVERTISACIVAKITSFSKKLYVNDEQFRFLEQVLYQALNILLDTNVSDSRIIQSQVKEDHPKTLLWLQKNKNQEKLSLAIRKRRDNNRRYFRYSANMSYHFIRVGGHDNAVELQGDIYSSGIKHFNKVMDEKLDKIVKNYTENIRLSLQNQYPEAYLLFIEVLEKLERLRHVLNGISIGIVNIKVALAALKKNVLNGLDYQSLNGNIRTEHILRNFEEKLNQLSGHTISLLENSSPHKLYQGPVLEKLKIDYDVKGYVEKNNKTPSKLLKAFIDLYHFTLLMEKVYNNISSSSYIIIFPEYWSKDYKDMSPGGFAFFTEFLVSKNDILELYFQIDVSKTEVHEFEIVHQKARVVRIEEQPELEKYLIACEFILCPESNIQMINHAIQGQEVKDAFNSSSLLDESHALGL